MLSYQHIYHAGNLADVHKHGLLAWCLEYLTRKDKPVTYIETHAGRGLYDLTDPAARKTGEAEAGIETRIDRFGADHPYAQTIGQLRSTYGENAYPGSPLIAASLLRPGDKQHLAELHPGEFDALRHAMSPFAAKCYHQNGFELAHSLCPPLPRRGLMLIDPSYEIKTDYSDIPRHISKTTKAWNVGIICLWYPILKTGIHTDMLSTLEKSYPQALRHEVGFPPAKKAHGMVGSGMFFINPPYGLKEETMRLGQLFTA